jgi:hypothetical protein
MGRHPRSERAGRAVSARCTNLRLYPIASVYGIGNHRYWTDPQSDARAAGAPAERLLFAHRPGLGLTDGFIKNTYEVLSPLNQLTALMPRTVHRFLNADRSVESTRFGDDVRIAVNHGAADVVTENTVLPRYGFVIESPTLVAFHARSYRGQTFPRPTMLVARSADGGPLASSSPVILHVVFGDAPSTWAGKPVTIRK